MVMAEPWTHGFAEVEPGVRLHYVELQPDGPSSAPPLVLLHGFPECWWSWRRQLPALAAAGHHVIAPDMRGFNLSDKPAGRDAYRLERLAADIPALFHHLGVERAVLVGHDWGGAVAWQAALDYPETFPGLVAINAVHPRIFLAQVRRTIFPNLRQLRRSWYIFALQAPWAPEFVLSRRNFGLIERAFRRGAQPGTFSEDDIREYKRAAAQHGALTASVNYYRAAFRDGLSVLRHPRSGRMPKLKVPALVLWSEEDAYLGTELTHGLERYVEGSLEIVFVPGASHWLPQERPDVVVTRIREFVARL